MSLLSPQQHRFLVTGSHQRNNAKFLIWKVTVAFAQEIFFFFAGTVLQPCLLFANLGCRSPPGRARAAGRGRRQARGSLASTAEFPGTAEFPSSLLGRKVERFAARVRKLKEKAPGPQSAGEQRAAGAQPHQTQ